MNSMKPHLLNLPCTVRFTGCFVPRPISSMQVYTPLSVFWTLLIINVLPLTFKRPPRSPFVKWPPEMMWWPLASSDGWYNQSTGLVDIEPPHGRCTVSPRKCEEWKDMSDNTNIGLLPQWPHVKKLIALNFIAVKSTSNKTIYSISVILFGCYISAHSTTTTIHRQISR